jgi:DNA (cytosine-5)-methyltransferase 1
VLATRFANIPIHDDITTLKGDQFGPVDIISGGFPCQDISAAGRGAGLSGDRSGLWYEMHRVICEAKPRFVVIENSPLLRRRGLDKVLGGLDTLGYDAEWHCLPAGAIGAPHRRDRLWIVAYAMRPRLEASEQPDRQQSPGILSTEIWRSVTERSRWSPEPDVGRVAHGVSKRVDRLRCLGNAVVPAIPYLIGLSIQRAASQK